jgi:hypothetical protein
MLSYFSWTLNLRFVLFNALTPANNDQLSCFKPAFIYLRRVCVFTLALHSHAAPSAVCNLTLFLPLFCDASVPKLFSVEWQDNYWMINCKGFERTRPWHNPGTAPPSGWKPRVTPGRTAGITNGAVYTIIIYTNINKNKCITIRLLCKGVPLHVSIFKRSSSGIFTVIQSYFLNYISMCIHIITTCFIFDKEYYLIVKNI